MTNTPIDLKARAHQAMLEAGFRPDFPADVLHEVQLLKQGAPKADGPGVRDLRSLLWSSIDNDSSRDLDQVEYVEETPDGATRLLVGIADVDASVPKGSATDRQAAAETTSVYTGVTTFPMLPGELSTDLTSLLDAQDRLALVIELHILESGEVDGHEVYPARLRNRAKLAYSSTGAWLEGRAPDAAGSGERPGNGGATAPATANLRNVARPAQATRRAHLRVRRSHAGGGERRTERPDRQPAQRRRGHHRELHGGRQRGDGPVPEGEAARCPSGGW